MKSNTNTITALVRPWMGVSLFAALLCFALIPAQAADALRAHDIETVATVDVTLKICKSAYPTGFAQLQSNLEKSMQHLHAPVDQLRADPNYQDIYTSQLNALIAQPAADRIQMCKDAAQ